MKRRADTPSQSQPKTPDGDLKQGNARKERSRKAVYIYIATLFGVVLIFILLSYFVQLRNNSEISTLYEKNATAQQNIENLQSTNLQLQTDNDSYKEKISDLQNQINDLKLQWESDVQTITEQDKAKYNELLSKYNALAKKYGVKVITND